MKRSAESANEGAKRVRESIAVEKVLCTAELVVEISRYLCAEDYLALRSVSPVVRRILYDKLEVERRKAERRRFSWGKLMCNLLDQDRATRLCATHPLFEIGKYYWPADFLGFSRGKLVAVLAQGGMRHVVHVTQFDDATRTWSDTESWCVASPVLTGSCFAVTDTWMESATPHVTYFVHGEGQFDNDYMYMTGTGTTRMGCRTIPPNFDPETALLARHCHVQRGSTHLKFPFCTCSETQSDVRSGWKWKGQGWEVVADFVPQNAAFPREDPRLFIVDGALFEHPARAELRKVPTPAALSRIFAVTSCDCMVAIAGFMPRHALFLRQVWICNFKRKPLHWTCVGEYSSNEKDILRLTSDGLTVGKTAFLF